MKNDELAHIEGVAALENKHHDTTNAIKRQCIFINWQGGLNLALLATALFCGYNWNKRIIEAAEFPNHKEITQRIIELELYILDLNEVIASIKESPPDRGAGQ